MSEDFAPSGEVTPDAGTDGPDTSTTEAPEAPQSPSYEDRISERLEQLAQQNSQLASSYEQLLNRIPEPEEADDEDDYLDPDDPDYEEQLQAKAFRDAVREEAQQLITPLQQQQAERDIANGYAALQSKYPELQDDKVAQPIIDAVSEYAESVGMDVRNPGIVRLIETFYKATVADKHAQQETPAGQRRDVQLESGAGAAAAEREDDPQARIIEAAQKMQVL